MCANAGSFAKCLFMAVTGCMCFLSCDFIEDVFGKEEDDNTTKEEKVEKAYQKIKLTADSILLSDDPIAGFEKMKEKYKQSKKYEFVKDMEVTDVGFFIELTNGYTKGWLIVPSDVQTSTYSSPKQVLDKISDLKSTGYGPKKKIAIVNCRSNDFVNRNDIAYEIASLFDNKDWEVVPIYGKQANLNFFRTKLNEYDVVYIDAHGFANSKRSGIVAGNSEERGYTILTIEEILSQQTLENQGDITIRVFGGDSLPTKLSTEPIITGDDITYNYSDASFHNSLIYLTSCNILRYPELFAARLIDKGAGVVIGYDNNVSISPDAGKELLSSMLLNNYNLSQAYNELPAKYKYDYFEFFPFSFRRCTLTYYPKTAGNYRLVETPRVNTVGHSNLTRTSVMLNGEIIPLNGVAVTEAGFYYTTAENSSANQKQESVASTSGSFSKNITGLIRGTKYLYKAYAKNAHGTAYGEIKQFTTLDDQGVTDDINKIVPKEIQKKMTDLGLPINGGGNPPVVNGTYKMSPVILKKSNFSDGFSVGHQFADIYVTFSEQNNDDLTVKVSYVNAGLSGEGTGAYIIGEGDKFSVFVESINIHENKVQTKTAEVYSGTITNTGIKNLYSALFMIDDGGDPYNDLIGNGQGRLFYDSDGFSEKVTSGARSASGNAERLPSILHRK
jgi:hypothetical protein